MVCDEAVYGLARRGGTWNALVDRQQRPAARSTPTSREQPEHRFSPFEYASVGRDQVHGRLEALTRDLRETGGDLRILKGLKLGSVADMVTPARHPEAAETTVPVEHEERPGRWCADESHAAHRTSCSRGGILCARTS